MKKIEVQVSDEILGEVENILQSIGMDIDMAINIYLRRIVIEKGIPMIMTGTTTKKSEPEIIEGMDEEMEYRTNSAIRTNNKITMEMVDEVWNSFQQYLKGLGEINPLSIEIANKTGMNRGSAFIYLLVLANLVEGKPNTRVIKTKDLEYLMSKIKSELGKEIYQKSIKSLMGSIFYWNEKISGAYAKKVEEYCKKNM